MRIAHISDIHIRLYSRHDEYREVFSRLYQSLKSKNIDRIILAGDIFHSKSVLSPEAVNLAAEFFSELSKIAMLDILVGNHDVNLRNDQRLDAITPIVSKLTSKTFNIRVLDKSLTYEVRDVMFGVFSLLDESNFPILKSKNDKTSIALFHGCLVGSMAENQYVFTESNYDPTIMFKNYDAVLLGDIHRRQKIGSNGWYSGSLIQQDFGEEVEKGYLIWDTDDLQNPEFVPVKNDYVYYNLKASYKVDKTNVPQLKDAAKKPRIRLTLSGHEYTVAEIKQIEIELQKYNPVALEVKREVASIQVSTEISKIKSTASVENQEVLIRDFLKKLDPAVVDRVVEINKVVRSRVLEDSILQPISWKFKEIEWENTFSYGPDNRIVFDKLKGITGIFAPNRSGKSNFIDTLLYNLFNKSARMSKITRIINNKASECKASSILEIDGELYKISRFSKRNADGTNTKVVLEKRENGAWSDASGESRTDTDKIIRSKIGSFDDIILSSISPQGKISSFLEAGLDDTFRLEFLSRFLGLNIFKLQYEIAHKEVSDLEALVKQFKDTPFAEYIQNYKLEISKLEESLSDLEEDRDFLSVQSESLKQQIANLSAIIQPIDESEASQDPSKFEEAKKQLETQLTSIQSQIKSETESLLKLQAVDLDQKFEELQKEKYRKDGLDSNLKEIKSSIATKKALLSRDKSSLEILEKQPWTDSTEICQKCQFYLDASKIRTIIHNAESSIEQLEKLKAEVELKLKSLLSLDEDIKKCSDLIQNRDRLSSSIEIKKVQSENFSLQIEKTQQILNSLNDHRESIEINKQIAELNKQIENSVQYKKSELATISSQLQSVEYSITSHHKKIAELEVQIQNAEKSIEQMSQYESSLSDYKVYMKCVHREGLPYTIISSYIDIINGEIQKIVGDYIPFSIKLSLDLEKKMVPINIVYEDGTVNPIEMGSGMEKTISAIALRAALSSISNIPKPNLFIIDESFGTLDPNWIGSIDKFLKHLKSMFDHIILISHVQEIQDYVDQTITIDTSNGYSKLNYE